MIARSWRGAVRPDDAEAYAHYIDDTGMKEYASTPGNQGAWMLQRPVGDLVEFVTFSLWDSLDAIKAFAGDDYETAVFYPEDDRYLVERDETVHALGGRARRRRLAWRAVSDAGNGAGRALVSVVVPVYNEQATVAQVVEELLELGLRLEVLLVDDGSTDGSPAELTRLAAAHAEVKVLTQPANRGKGAAVRRGINESSGDFLLIQDADLEYSPSDIPALIDPLLSGKADAVFGTRLRGGAHPQRAHLFWHYAGNRFLTLLANVLYNTTISDMEVGYKAFKGDLVRGLDLISDDFRIEPELTAKVLRLGPDIRLYEVPISYYGRSYAEGKKITWRDGFGAVGALLRFRFTR